MENKRIWWQNHYNQRKKYYVIKARKRAIIITDMINKIKSDKGCMNCPEHDPICLDFHHRDEKTKINTVSKIKLMRGLQVILDEIEKCDILCSNCHRKVTRDRRLGIVPVGLEPTSQASRAHVLGHYTKGL